MVETILSAILQINNNYSKIHMITNKQINQNAMFYL